MYLMGQILFQLKSPPNFHVTEYMLSQPNARRVSIFFTFIILSHCHYIVHQSPGIARTNLYHNKDLFLV